MVLERDASVRQGPFLLGSFVQEDSYRYCTRKEPSAKEGLAFFYTCANMQKQLKISECGVTANIPALGAGDSGFESLHSDNKNNMHGNMHVVFIVAEK